MVVVKFRDTEYNRSDNSEMLGENRNGKHDHCVLHIGNSNNAQSLLVYLLLPPFPFKCQRTELDWRERGFHISDD